MQLTIYKKIWNTRAKRDSKAYWKVIILKCKWRERKIYWVIMFLVKPCDENDTVVKPGRGRRWWHWLEKGRRPSHLQPFKTHLLLRQKIVRKEKQEESTGKKKIRNYVSWKDISILDSLIQGNIYENKPRYGEMFLVDLFVLNLFFQWWWMTSKYSN